MTCGAEREKQLMADGWVRQFMADEPRLGEAVAEYRKLGFEVWLEPVDPEACAAAGGCTACFADPAQAQRFKVIYTRRPEAGPSQSLDEV